MCRDASSSKMNRHQPRNLNVGLKISVPILGHIGSVSECLRDCLVTKISLRLVVVLRNCLVGESLLSQPVDCW